MIRPPSDAAPCRASLGTSGCGREGSPRRHFDAILAGTGGAPTGDYGASGFGFNIGGGGVFDGTGNQFTGSIDEVAVWDTALTVGQIEDHYAAAEDGGEGPTGTKVLPGDSNGDGTVNISDPVVALNFLFAGGESLEGCYLSSAGGDVELNETVQAVLDWNGDGSHNIADAVASLTFQFASGSPHNLGEECTEIAAEDCEDLCQ